MIELNEEQRQNWFLALKSVAGLPYWDFGSDWYSDISFSINRVPMDRVESALIYDDWVEQISEYIPLDILFDECPELRFENFI